MFVYIKSMFNFEEQTQRDMTTTKIYIDKEAQKVITIKTFKSPSRVEKISEIENDFFTATPRKWSHELHYVLGLQIKRNPGAEVISI